jgi:hypothetical protein
MYQIKLTGFRSTSGALRPVITEMAVTDGALDGRRTINVENLRAKHHLDRPGHRST